jgi:succinyl-CoA synthetase beta subunit
MSTAPMPDALAPVPGYRFPEAAGIALARAVAYSTWRERPPGHRKPFEDLDNARMRRIATSVLEQGGGWLPPEDAADFMRRAGIPLAESATAADEEIAADHADRLGYPVVLKAVGPDILHKTDVGGLRLNLTREDDVRLAWRDMKSRLGGRMSGGLIQKMVTGGVEMLVGIVDDPTFGHVIACATGGTMTEVLADRQLRLHPLTDVDAADMVEGLRGAVLLQGYRGSPPVDRQALIEVLLRLSAVIDVCPEIRELDINPLVVLPSGTCGLDVRIRIERPLVGPPSRRVSY